MSEIRVVADAGHYAEGSQVSPGSPTLRSHLARLVLAVLLPAVTIGGAAAWSLAESYSDAFESRLRDTVRALALFMDSEIDAQIVTVSSLASSPLLTRGDLPAFTVWARGVGATVGGWVVVNDAAPGHQQLVNTSLPDGAALPPPSPPGQGAWNLIRRVAETGQPAVSDLFNARGARRAAVAVAAPVIKDDRVIQVVVIGLDLERLSSRLAAQGPSGHAYASVADSGGRIVVRSRDQDRFVGTIPPSRLVPAEQRAGGVFQAKSVYGETALYAARPLTAAPGWSIVVAEPYSRYRASWLGPIAALVAGAAGAMTLGVLVATRLARRVLQPLDALVRRAEATVAGTGEPDAAPRARVAEFEVLRAASARAEAALATREAAYRAIFETAAAGVVEIDVATRRYVRVNRRFCQLTGRSETELLGGLGPTDVVHPDDRDRTPGNVVAQRGGEAENECRVLRPDGTILWVHASAAVSAQDEAGNPLRAVSIIQDVTERHRAEEARTLLAREVDHRAKNALAVVQAAMRLTPREDPNAYIRALEGRIIALARTHSLLADNLWAGIDMMALGRTELAAFVGSLDADPTGGPHVELTGPALTLTPGASQALAMTLHELATNATRHGALSMPNGRVSLSWYVDEVDAALRLRWAEQGGPLVPGPPERLGFGSRLIETSIRGQLGGKSRMTWLPRGMVFEAEIPVQRVTAVPMAA